MVALGSSFQIDRRSRPDGGVVVVAVAATGSGQSRVECKRSCSRRIRRVQKCHDAVYDNIQPESRNRRDPIVGVRYKDGRDDV